MRKDGLDFDGSNTTNRILDVLEQERPKIIFIDEVGQNVSGVELSRDIEYARSFERLCKSQDRSLR
jgi:hypothetical protein